MTQEKPILFSGPMVRAILEGRKTKTRRGIKGRPEFLGPKGSEDDLSQWGRENDDEPGTYTVLDVDTLDRDLSPWPLPYKTYDLLWVRESWRTETKELDVLKPSLIRKDECKTLYEADGNWRDNHTVGKLRPSMFMPRWASRITLLVTGVKVERLQDISEEDAIAEGVEPHPTKQGYFKAYEEKGDCWRTSARQSFEGLWQSINGPDSWASNPWVAAYSFELANTEKVG